MWLLLPTHMLRLKSNDVETLSLIGDGPLFMKIDGGYYGAKFIGIREVKKMMKSGQMTKCFLQSLKNA